MRRKLIATGIAIILLLLLRKRFRFFMKNRSHRRRMGRFRKIATDHPGTIEAAGAHYTMGLIFQNNMDCPQKAIQEYEKVLEIGSELADSALFNMGCCLENLGEEGRARKAFADVLKKFPGSTRVEDAQYKIDELALKNS
jgi:TolA-binding protein